MASFTRQSTYTDGDVINAADSNDEFNQLLAAFDNTTGHAHDGTAAEGPVIGLIGDPGVAIPLNKVVVSDTNNRVGVFVDVAAAAVEQIRFADGVIAAVTDNDIDLGAVAAEFKDGFFDGTVYADTLSIGDTDTIVITDNDFQVTGALTLDVSGDITLDADGGDILFADAGVTFGSATNTAGDLIIKSGTTTALTFSGANVTAAGTLTATSGGALTGTWSDLGTVSTMDLDGGSIDGAIIGAAGAAAATVTALTANTSFVLNGSTALTSVDTDISAVSAAHDTIPTALATKTYVDAQLTASDLDFSADSGGVLAIDLDTETLTLTGGTGITTTGLSNDVSFAIDSTVATLTGTQTLTNKSIDLTNNTLTGTSLELKTAISDETGAGALVFATSPTLITPALGTPASGVMTNVTGTASGLTAGNVTTNANLTGHVTSVGNAATLGSFTLAQLSTAVSDATVVDLDDAQALTNKTFDTAANTVSNIATSMFATNVVDTDTTLAANSDTRLGSQKAFKTYVDNLITGLKWKESVTVASTANLTLSGEQTIDGVLTSANRVLVKDQTAGAENGIYVTAAGAWSRSTDADTASEITGSTVFVEQGTVAADTQWTMGTDSVTLDTTALVYSQVSGAGTYSAGTGIGLTSNQFAVTGVLEDLVTTGVVGADGEMLVGSAAGATVWESGATLRTSIGTAIGSDVQAHSAVLDATTASFLTADETKLDGIEALADVTDVTNVTAAGALMDSEVDANIKTLVLPASTTISTFGATLVDDASAATARTTLGVDAAGTDNSTDITLAGTGTYLSLTGQAITVDPITESDVSDLQAYILAGSTDTLTNKTFDANGTGNSLSNVDVADLANGVDGELITWSATGVATTIPVGTIGQALTSQGAGAVPTWTSAGSGDALVANPLSQFAATTSAQLAGVVSDETGSGALVFGTSPTFVTPALGTPASGVVTNLTGTPTLDGLFLNEKAAADADVAGDGQIWIKNTTPNEIWWTDDAGTDTQLGSGGGGGGKAPILYTSNDTWTKPAGLVSIRVWTLGAGGGGGGCVSTSTNNGQSGSGGALAVEDILEAALGATETITIGAGGAGGAAGDNSGAAGGNSTFGAHNTGTGGVGGLNPTHANRASVVPPSIGTGGDYNYEAYLVGRNNVTVEYPTSSVLTPSSLILAPPNHRQWVEAEPSTLLWRVDPGNAGVAGSAAGGWAYSFPGGGADGNGSLNLAGGAGTDGLIVIQEYFS